MGQDRPPQQPRPAGDRGRHEAVLAYAIHAGILFTLLAFAFRPEGRTWGVSVWAHVPVWVSGTWVAVALVAPLLLVRLAARLDARPRSLYRLASAVLGIGLAVAFATLRARTHFLGDGYQHLARMTAAQPRPKFTSFGEDWIHIAAVQLVGGDRAAAALLVYQGLSVAAGIIFVLLTLRFAAQSFSTTSQRLIFAAGMCCCGPMLLFFGYVESYSLFIVSTIATSFVALAVLRGFTSWVWLVPLLLLTTWLHVFGLLMLPGCLFAFWYRSTWRRRIRSWSRVQRTAVAVAAAALVVVPVVHRFRSDLFLQLAVVPLLPTPFTVEGYTLLSQSHVLDWLNLAFVMLPSLPLFLGALRPLHLGQLMRVAEYRYLAIALVTTTLASLVLDPKLGMPRDWDLYTPFGVHLTLFFFYLLADKLDALRSGRLLGAMAIVLGVSVLAGRVAEGVNPDAALRRFDSYLTLDRTKGMNSHMLMVRYHEGRGDTEAAKQATARWNREYPERGLVRAGARLWSEGRLEESLELNLRALEINPIVFDAYTNLGLCFLSRRELTASQRMFEIANGLNPGNVFITARLGEVHYQRGDYAAAEKWWLRAWAIDPRSRTTNQMLAMLYRKLGRAAESEEYARAAATSPDAPGERSP